MPDNEVNPVLGIDLGTTYSAIARWDGQRPRSYQVDQGQDTLASVVYYDPNGSLGDQWLVGKQALKKGLLYPQNMARYFKRHIGDTTYRFLLGNQQFSSIDLSAKLLEHLYQDLVKRFHIKSRGTVVTVPYYFKKLECTNTCNAAETANINFREILQEPIAASLSYTWERVNNDPTREGEEKILVFDLGGGTFDLTLFRLQQTRSRLIFEVLATEGHHQLGGIEFDDCLVDLLLKKSDLCLNDLESSKKRIARLKLLEAAIEAKKTLSATQNTDVAIFDIIPNRNIDITVTRTEFEDRIQEHTNQIRQIMQRLWTKARIQPKQVDRIILVGGSSRIPCMASLLEEQIGSGKVYESPRPELCVAEGAAIYAAYLDNQPVFGNREVEIHTQVKKNLLEDEENRPKSLKSQLESEKNQRRQLESQLESEKNQRRQLESQLESEKNQRRQLESQLESEKNQRRQLESQLETILGGITVPHYQQLHDFLKEGNWRDADKTTHLIMGQVANVPKTRPCLNREEIENFPCDALRIIDQLWVKLSNGRFGFSVQKRIWENCGGNSNIEVTFPRFCDAVGWRVNRRELLTYRDLTFNLSAPQGHLPVVASCQSGFKGRCPPDISSLVSRLVNCHIF